MGWATRVKVFIKIKTAPRTPRSLLSSNQGEDAAALQGVLGEAFSLAQTGWTQLHKHTDADACAFTVISLRNTSERYRENKRDQQNCGHYFPATKGVLPLS